MRVAAGRGRSLHQAWADLFLTGLDFERSSRQSPVTDQGVISADAQWALLLDYRLLQSDDLFVRAISAPAAYLNRVPCIARAPHFQRRGAHHD